jgi:hypothetical protein
MGLIPRTKEKLGIKLIVVWNLFGGRFPKIVMITLRRALSFLGRIGLCRSENYDR